MWKFRCTGWNGRLHRPSLHRPSLPRDRGPWSQSDAWTICPPGPVVELHIGHPSVITAPDAQVSGGLWPRMTGVVDEHPVANIPIAPESSTASVQRSIELTPWFSPETALLRSMQKSQRVPNGSRSTALQPMLSAMRISLITVIGRSNSESCKIPTNPRRNEQEEWMVLRKRVVRNTVQRLFSTSASSNDVRRKCLRIQSL